VGGAAPDRGLAPEEADAALAYWVETGLVQLDSEKPEPAAARPAPPPGAGAVDAALELPVEFQREVLAFEERLAGATHHEILGVDRNSDAREIKRAYFALSKRFHPDRYFRRSIGDYAARLDRIFRHVALAYELLSDPATREELEKAMAVPTAAEPAKPEPEAKPGPGYRAPTRMENLARLRRVFRIPPQLLAERRIKARQFHQAARVAAHEKRWLEAAAGARLAIAFDPTAPEYLEHFASIQADVHAARADGLLAEAEGAHPDALRLLEEAIHYRPADAKLQARAAALAFEAGEHERAREFADSARELEPESVAHALMLVRIHRKRSDLPAARAALAAAVALSPSDPDVLAEQRRMRGTR
jgi:tetratricopeptide (TPR) repeat protein